jgi:ribosome recycling factor
MVDTIKRDARERMKKSIEVLRLDLVKLRTGRANASLLDHVNVNYYGSAMPINQVANVNVSDARTLTVQPWEKKMVPESRKPSSIPTSALTP